MTDTTTPAPTTDLQSFAKSLHLLSHVTRLKILIAMRDTQRALSPSDLTEILGEALGNVSYHMRFLCDGGFVHLTRTEPRRGAVEHYYVPDPKAISLLEIFLPDDN